MAKEPHIKKDSIDVLHVDDNNQMRTLFQDSLEQVDGAFTVTSVGDPVAVLDRLDTDIECIVSDYEMPTMNGLELLRAVSADRPDLPFILLTGKGSEEVASEAISAGLTDYFRKSDIAQQFPVLAQRIENVVEGERAEVSYRELFKLAAEGFALHHPETGAFIDANPAFLDIFGVERAELLSMGLNDLWSIPGRDHQETTLSDHFQRATTDGMTSTEECCQRASGERFWVEFKFKPIEVKGRSLVLTQARDITDRRRYEQTLSALHTAVTDIVAADQSRQVTGTVLSTVDNLLAADRGAVFRHVSAKNWLEVVDAMSLPSVASEVPLDPDHPLARAFIDGRPVEVDAVSIFGGQAGDDTGHGLTLFMPIGSAGVLAIGYDDRRSVAPHDSEFVEILANAAAAAFERFEREQEIDSGQQEISRQSEELHRLERVNATLRGLNESLLRAETRDEIFEAVCDQVSDIEGVKLAWIGVPTEESVLDRRAWAGDIPQYLDNITLELDSSEEPATVAFQTGRSVHVANTAIDIRQQPWKQTALSYGVESVVAIPIEEDGVTSGVLSVLSADQNAFSGRFERMLSAIASSVGETLQSVEQRHALQSGATTELAFEIDGVDHLLGRLAADADCELDVTGVIPEPGATCRVFAAVEGASPKSVTEVAATMSAVRSATIATDNGPDGVVELHLETPLLGAQLRESPVRISELSASPNSVQAGLEIAQTDIVRDVASDILDRYPSAQLVSKGTQNADGSDYERLVAFRESLTPRQREVVHTAYLNGYFQSPRHCTGKELGEKLGISSQAVYQHLRAAERQLFDEAFRQTRTVSANDE